MEIRIDELRAMIAKSAYDAEHNGRIVARLKSNSAWVIDCGDIKVLKSYNTYVACMYDGGVVAFDSYSATTSQHIYKFAREYKASGITFPYERADHKIWKNLACFHDAYLTFEKGKDCGYVKESVRRQMNKDLREKTRKSGYKHYLRCPVSMIGEYVLLSANHESMQSFIDKWYPYTVRKEV